MKKIYQKNLLLFFWCLYNTQNLWTVCEEKITIIWRKTKLLTFFRKKYNLSVKSSMTKSKLGNGLLFNLYNVIVWITFFQQVKLTLFIIKSRIKCIEVLTVQVILHNPETFTETLEVYNFSCTQEFNRIINIWVIFYKAKNIVVSSTCFLFCGDFVRTTLHNIIWR